MMENKKGYKPSTLVFLLIILFAILLVIMSFQESPDEKIISIYSDILKILSGALAGAIMGERKNV